MRVTATEFVVRGPREGSEFGPDAYSIWVPVIYHTISSPVQYWVPILYCTVLQVRLSASLER